MKTTVAIWLFGLAATLLGFPTFALKSCPKENLDIFFVIDSSRSITERNFKHLRHFLSSLVGQFKVGEFESRIGLMQFSEQFRTVIEFNFGKHKTTSEIQENINKLIHHKGQTTYTGKALKMVKDKVFNGDSKDREKVLILITDGQPHDINVVFKEAEELKKKKGVHLVTIGAGSDKWISKFKYELSRIGSKPTHNHRVRYANLQRITRKLVHTVCNINKREPAPPHKCFQEKQDLLVILDGSEGIGQRHFAKVKKFLQDFLSRLDVGPDRVHVGMIQFSDSFGTTIEIAFNQYTTVEDVAAAVGKVIYQSGKEADLGHALRLAKLMVLNGDGGDRVTAPDTILIFTDGEYKNKDRVLQLIHKLKKANTRIVSIGVEGKERVVNQDNIDALALDTGDIYDLADLDASAFLDDMSPTTCKMVTCTTAPPKCAPENQDIIFLMDGSAQIGKTSFRSAQRYLKRLTGKMTLGKDQSHAGLIQYCGNGIVNEEVTLGKQVLRGSIMNAISKMKFKNCLRKSDLAYALTMASDKLLHPVDRSRKDVTKTIVIITDGDVAHFAEVYALAETLRNKGIRILTLSTGQHSEKPENINSLRLIASGPKEYYNLGNSYFNAVLKELQQTVCISEPNIPDTCFQKKRKLFFVLDSSRGRGRAKFREVRDFVETFASKLHLGAGQTHVGFLQYDDPKSSGESLVIPGNYTADETLSRIRNMEYRKGQGSYLGKALETVNEKVFVYGTGNDPDYKNVLIIFAHTVISDSQLAFDESEKLKKKGVEIISIATGSKKKIPKVKSQLQVLSTTPTNVHSADYSKLWDVVEDVLVNLCGLGKCPAFSGTICKPKKQDIVFAIDGSRSVGKINFKRLIRFTERLTSRLDLAENRTHLGLLQIGAAKNAKFQFNMGEFPDRSDVLYMVKDTTYLDDMSTYMGSGLRKIRTEIFNKKWPDRPFIDNTLVLFTDGESHDPWLMLEEAEKLKANGVKILAIGYGTETTLSNRDNLLKMATNKKDTFSIDFTNDDLMLEEQIDVIAKHLVQVDCPRGYTAPIECSQGAIDLLLVVDGSRSINKRNFRTVKKFLKKLASEFDVGVNATHIGLLQFSDEISLSYEFGLGSRYNTKGVKRAIKEMDYKAGGKTLTGLALKKVNLHIFNHKYGDRADIPDVLILFTDGHAHDFHKALKHANAMKKRNIRIIAIAAGQEAKDPKLVRQLEQIASDPLDVYTSEFSELTDIVHKLIDIDCTIKTDKMAKRL